MPPRTYRLIPFVEEIFNNETNNLLVSISNCFISVLYGTIRVNLRYLFYQIGDTPVLNRLHDRIMLAL